MISYSLSGITCDGFSFGIVFGQSFNRFLILIVFIIQTIVFWNVDCTWLWTALWISSYASSSENKVSQSCPYISIHNVCLFLFHRKLRFVAVSNDFELWWHSCMNNAVSFLSIDCTRLWSATVHFKVFHIPMIS